MPALQITNLSKTYRNGPQALKGIDLTVESEDFFALLGPNGAGKSTAIGIICSLVNKSDGKVEVFGNDLDNDLLGVKRHIGLVPQEFNFNQFEPVIEILINQAGYYGIERSDAAQRAEKRLKQLNLWEKRNTIARNLSGGMKRRLMIARALVHDPRLLILDEPTAGVDIEIRMSMWEFLRKINEEGTTIILTTHYLEEAENLCRNIAIIDNGMIIENSSINVLLERLQQEIFVLDIDTAVSEAPAIEGYSVTLRNAQSLQVTVDKASGLTRLFCALAEQNIEVLSLRNKQNRLEQLFLEMTRESRSPVEESAE
ncbi:ABC transporter ATP-binding protein [Solemya velum gill symbiont]|uniref:ABC transporter ATP-binding protein n=1 Tax=Solemya velum gill symbiont TaxID=2340 RepID=UPI00099657EF|nr:ABC transporter ATP-binding protein [Solemya velum gill symbiont]OOZ44361.1 ABC transporter [Solemya velum gill symbiont]OOZ46609.1 ABC transporter [Solemya velum gill symbiont]OOZ48931.1 ABC transporter [Solemya velum gill symbiont]OOZ51418.1 ABC transporter [Solemya velum gill symbiont]OOZ53993.1 ABC transporter [Solemya velum gill symbiont]